MRSLNIDQLSTFLAVVENASFSAAARALHLTQPAVSMQVKELEARLGVQLLARAGRNVAPTPAGRDLVVHARQLLREIDRTLATMTRHREGGLGRVRIGASTTALIYHLPPVLNRLRREHPEVELEIASGTTAQIADRLERNELDLGLVTLPVASDALEVTPLVTEPLVAIFSATAKKVPREVTPALLTASAPVLELPTAQVRRLIDRWLARAGEVSRPMIELDNLEAIKTVVAAGLGVSIVPIVAVTGARKDVRLTVRPLAPPLVRTLAVLSRRGEAIGGAEAAVRHELLRLGPPAKT